MSGAKRNLLLFAGIIKIYAKIKQLHIYHEITLCAVIKTALASGF